MLKTFETTILIFFLWAAPLCADQGIDPVAMSDRETGEHIEMMLQNRSSIAAGSVGVSRLLSHEEIFYLYQQRKFLPIWLNGLQLKAEAQMLLEHLRNAGMHGLCGNDWIDRALGLASSLSDDTDRSESLDV